MPGEPSLGRRELLKILAAAGGAATLSGGLPGRWVRPVVEAGLLPAHAQTSGATLTNPSAAPQSGTCTGSTGVPGILFGMQMDYLSPTGAVLAGSVIRQSFLFEPTGLTGANEKTLAGSNISGDGVSGAITYDNCIGFSNNTTLYLTLQLVDANGAASSPLTLTIPNPGTPGSTGAASVSPR